MEKAVNSFDSLIKFLSEGISFLFNPLLLAPMMFGYLWLFQTEQLVSFSYFAGVVGVFFSLLPLLILIVFKKMKRIQSIEVRNRANRPLPFLFGIFSYTFGVILIGNALLWQGLAVAGVLSMLVGSLITGLITLKWKVSIHCTGATIAAVFIIAAPLLSDLQSVSIIHILCSGILLFGMMWSRVNLRAHTLSQCIAGTVIGFTTAVGCIQFISF